MSYKPQVKVPNDEFTSNGLAFATEEEALASARCLMDRWFLVIDYRAIESDQPVNYHHVDGKDISL